MARSSSNHKDHKIAIIHDWLTGMRGGEKVLKQFLNIYPQAEVFTLLNKKGSVERDIEERVVETSCLQNFPFADSLYRHYLPFFPLATKSLNISGYDLVISLSHAAAKNVPIKDNSIHICYCFTPMRYIWDQSPSYFGNTLPLAWPLIKSLRKWDIQGNKRVNHFIGISKFIAARIRKFYHRKANIIYPPVDNSWLSPIKTHFQGEAFLTAGALVPYKNFDIVIEAFNQLQFPLWVVGDGSKYAYLKKISKKNIKFFGKVSNNTLAEIFQRCRAFIFAGIEDFGIMPIECQAVGRPAIAVYKGGMKEVVNGYIPWLNNKPHGKESGIFFRFAKNKDAYIENIKNSIKLFIEHEQLFTPKACLEWAQCFSPERFKDNWLDLTSKIISQT